jgi:hypothetical protein
MINLSYSVPYKGEVKELKLKGHIGIGIYEDVDGKRWDVHSYIGGCYTKDGKPKVHARIVDSCSKYSTGSCWGEYYITYNPYHVSFINNKE